MINNLSIWVQVAIFLFAYGIFWFLVSILIKRNDIADIAWGIGFMAVAWISYLSGVQNNLSLITTALVSLWGIRLSTHILIRNKGKAEDYRYKKWRNQWGKWFYLRSFFQVYLLQMFFLYLISVSFVYINTYSKNESISMVFWVGIVIWTIGFFFESMGDYQLYQFKKNGKNKGKIMKKGVWSYTRHPNYFGEVAQWWGIYMICLTIKGGAIMIISPITITLLILGVSGIPMLEKKYKGNKEYEAYQKETNAFFPWWPKKQVN